MNTFHEKINAPVDMAAEVKAYEEAQSLDRGEPVPEPESEPVEDAAPQDESQAEEHDQVEEGEPDTAVDEHEPPKHPGAAFKAYREQTRKAKEEAQSLREELARRDGEQRAWQTLQQQQQAQPEVPPIDPTINPIEALQRLTAESQQMREHLQYQQITAEVQRQYRADAVRFETATPDFREAYQHALNSRARQLTLAGATPDQVAQQVTREEMELAYTALQQGRSPAETLYRYAKEIYGYQPGGGKPRGADGRFQSIEQEQKKAAAATTMRGGTAPRSGLAPPELGVQQNGKNFDAWFDKWAASQKAGKKKIEWR